MPFGPVTNFLLAQISGTVCVEINSLIFIFEMLSIYGKTILNISKFLNTVQDY
jgi:hypothetical protein